MAKQFLLTMSHLTIIGIKIAFIGVILYTSYKKYPHNFHLGGNMRLYRRELYLSKIRGFYDDAGMIKVLTGIRRCGKSCILQAVVEELRESGVEDDRLVNINLDKKAYRKIKTPDQLEELIDSLSPSDDARLKYLFIDEVENVEGFEEVVNAYREEGDWSIFITGSNSYLLSGELATKLTGRYLEVEVFTLTFHEYLDMKNLYDQAIDPNLAVEFGRYLAEGGFPKAIEYPDEAEKAAYTASVIREIIEKDIRRNNKIKHLSVFDRVMDYAVSNFGAPTSVKNILDHFTRVEGIPIKRETLNRYLQILVDAKILYRCKRFDLKSRRSLGGEMKYYLADISIYNMLNTDARINFGPVLENIAYNYARSMGYAVSVGRIGKLECDFILRDNANDYAYVQVSRTIADSATEEREYRALEAIRDAWPKYLLTMDGVLQKRNGVIHANIESFMAAGRRF